MLTPCTDRPAAKEYTMHDQNDQISRDTAEVECNTVIKDEHQALAACDTDQDQNLGDSGAAHETLPDTQTQVENQTPVTALDSLLGSLKENADKPSTAQNSLNRRDGTRVRQWLLEIHPGAEKKTAAAKEERAVDTTAVPALPSRVQMQVNREAVRSPKPKAISPDSRNIQFDRRRDRHQPVDALARRQHQAFSSLIRVLGRCRLQVGSSNEARLEWFDVRKTRRRKWSTKAWQGRLDWAIRQPLLHELNDDDWNALH